MTPHTIYFVRHGETIWNTERRLQGRMDSPLTELGRAQARANAETLGLVPAVRSLPFVCSPLPRARSTMEIIRGHLDMPKDGYAVDERLAEMGFGAWEGLTLPEIRSTQPAAWAAREAAKWTHVPQGGESYAQCAARLCAWVGELREDVVVVAHGVVGRILRGLNLGMAHADIASSDGPFHDRVYRLSNGTEAAL